MAKSRARPTMSDIAARVGVSQATVSLVLGDAPVARISTRTRALVFAAAQELGYEKAAKPPDGGVIGLMIDELTTTQHVASLLEGARDEAASNGCLLSVVATQGNPEVEGQALSHLASRSVVGVIYATLMTQAVQPPSRLQDVPAVLLNCHAAGRRFPSIVPADGAGGAAATSALLEAGHRRVAIINGEDWVQASRDRLQGYCRALARHGLRPDPAMTLRGSWTVGSGHEQAARLLALPTPPTGIVCFCDRTALGAYDAIRAHGLRVPEDVSVVGFDDEAFARDMSPPLTTVTLPHELMARWAVTTLLDVNRRPGRTYRAAKMPCRLVPRRSVAPPAVMQRRKRPTSGLSGADMQSREGTVV